MTTFIYDVFPAFNYARVIKTEIKPAKDFSPVMIVNHVKKAAEIAGESFNPLEYLPSIPQIIEFDGAYAYNCNDIVESLAYSVAMERGLLKFVEVMHYEPAEVANARYNFYNNAERREELAVDAETPPQALEEAAFAFTAVDGKDRTIPSNVMAQVVNRIRNYTPKYPKALLLYGHTGISKSAIVKAAVKALDEERPNKWGYRVVDIRFGFYDKNDILGFTGTVEYEGELLKTDSPNLELIISSDSFVNACRDYLENNPDLETEEPELYKTLRHYAKTPVMFFDEVNRASKEMINILMGLINTGIIGGIVARNAPKIAAANVNVDEDSLAGIEYLVTEISDPASGAGRFDRLLVSHNDYSVITATKQYLITKFNDAELVEIISEAAGTDCDSQILYRPDMADKNGKFPTFRGWEFLLTYLQWGKDAPHPLVIEGCIGEKGRKALMSLPSFKKNFKVSDKPASIDVFLQHSFDAGLPVALFGRMGVAKTARLCSLVENNPDKYILFKVDLSVEDKTTVRGGPAQAPLASVLFGKYDTQGFTNKFEEFMEKHGVPYYTSAFTPFQNVVEIVRRAKKEGKKLVFLLDECNRAHPIVQSAIFDIISERRFKGVDLSDVDYAVVATGNWSGAEDDQIYSVKTLDSAVMHRFSTYFIKELTAADIQAYKEYLEKREPVTYEVLKGVLAQLTDDMLLKELNAPIEVDGDALSQCKVFTFRELSSLGQLLSENGYLTLHGLQTASSILRVLSSPDYVLNSALYKSSPVTIDRSRFDADALELLQNSQNIITLSELVDWFKKLLTKYGDKYVYVILQELTELEDYLLLQRFNSFIDLTFNDELKGIMRVAVLNARKNLTRNYLNTSLILLTTNANECYEALTTLLNQCDLTFHDAWSVVLDKVVKELEEADTASVPFECLSVLVEVYTNSEYSTVSVCKNKDIFELIGRYSNKFIFDAEKSVIDIELNKGHVVESVHSAITSLMPFLYLTKSDTHAILKHNGITAYGSKPASELYIMPAYTMIGGQTSAYPDIYSLYSMEDGKITEALFGSKQSKPSSKSASLSVSSFSDIEAAANSIQNGAASEIAQRIIAGLSDGSVAHLELKYDFNGDLVKIEDFSYDADSQTATASYVVNNFLGFLQLRLRGTFKAINKATADALEQFKDGVPYELLTFLHILSLNDMALRYKVDDEEINKHIVYSDKREWTKVINNTRKQIKLKADASSSSKTSLNSYLKKFAQLYLSKIL